MSLNAGNFRRQNFGFDPGFIRGSNSAELLKDWSSYQQSLLHHEPFESEITTYVDALTENSDFSEHMSLLHKIPFIVQKSDEGKLRLQEFFVPRFAQASARLCAIRGGRDVESLLDIFPESEGAALRDRLERYLHDSFSIHVSDIQGYPVKLALHTKSAQPKAGLHVDIHPATILACRRGPQIAPANACEYAPIPGRENRYVCLDPSQIVTVADGDTLMPVDPHGEPVIDGLRLAAVTSAVHFG